MKKSLEKGDTLVIKELDRIGRNQEELKREWEYFRNNEINVRVLDLPALNINYDDENIKPLAKMISNIIFEVMSWKAQNERETIRKRQAEGIAIAKSKNIKFGRPKTEIPSNFEEIFKQWKNGEITATKGIELTGLRRNKFYDFVKIYEREEIKNEKSNIKK